MMNRVEMSEKMMAQVNGGSAPKYSKPTLYIDAQTGCYGKILEKDKYLCIECGEIHNISSNS